MVGGAARRAIVQLDVRQGRCRRQARTARSPEQAATDRFAPSRCGIRPAAWRHPLRNAEIVCGEVSLCTSSDHCWLRGRLLRLDAGLLDDRPPLLGLGLVEGMKRFRGLLVAWEYLLAA